jgi:hypothetical protein
LAKQTGKGRQRRAGALERKATQHHDFIGDAAPERAEAEFRKHERLQAEENREAVQEMAAELNELAAKGGPELRVPRSLDEAKQAVADAKEAVRGAPDLLAEKARQRLGPFREPAEQALHVAAAAANVLLMPARIGLHLLREVVRLPFSVASALRDREA